MRFSVVCPTFDRGAALASTLDSVLAQTETSWELLVVSDQADAATEDVAADYARRDPRITLLRTDRRFGSAGGPRNLALAQAQGDYVAYLDHDDTYLPDHLTILGTMLDVVPWAVTGAIRVGPDGTPRGATGPLDLLWSVDLQVTGPLFEPTRTGHHRDLVPAAGGWSELGDGLEDWDLWLRLADAGISPGLTASRTVVLLEDRSTLRYALVPQFVHRFAVVADQAQARAVQDALAEPAIADRMRAACTEDAVEWLLAQIDAGVMGVPAGMVVTREELTARLAGIGTDLGRALVAIPEPDGVVLGVSLACLRREHAQRAADVSGQRAVRQREILAEVVSEVSARASGRG
jgi:hypothetical protein